MRILLYILILVGVMLLPARGTDVGKLIPVEVVAVSESDGRITVRTDTTDQGEGDTLQAAIDDLKATAPGIIYLDTAEYLLLEDETQDQLPAIGRHLKGRVRLCYGREAIPLDGIADFLSVHKPGVKLKTVSDSDRIPWITEENGRYRIQQK